MEGKTGVRRVRKSGSLRAYIWSTCEVSLFFLVQGFDLSLLKTYQMEILGALIIEAIMSFIGWVCLYVWYRDRSKIERVKNKKYGGTFSGAGVVLILNFVAGTGAIALTGILIFFLSSWIYAFFSH